MIKFISLWINKDLNIKLTIEASCIKEAKRLTREKYLLAKSRGLDWKLSPDTPKWLDESDITE